MQRSRIVVLLAALSLAALLAVGLATAATKRGAPAAEQKAARATVTRVTVNMGDFWFQLSKNVVPRGKVIFTVINKGDLEHDFVIGALNKKTPAIEGGTRTRLVVNFTKKGRFLYLCAVGEHFFRGMRGNLRVR